MTQPMTSPEKVRALYERLTTRDPADFSEAAMIMAGRQFGPSFLEQLPDDPAELDEHLVTLAGYVLSMRSDAAPVAAIAIQPAELEDASA